MRLDIDLATASVETEEQRQARALQEANKKLGIEGNAEEKDPNEQPVPVEEPQDEDGGQEPVKLTISSSEASTIEDPWARVSTLVGGENVQMFITPLRTMEDGTLLYANEAAPTFNLKTHVLVLNSIIEYMASMAEFYPILKRADAQIGNTFRHMLDSSATSISEALILLDAPSEKFPQFLEPDEEIDDSLEEDQYLRIQNASVDSNTTYVNQEVVHSILDGVLADEGLEETGNRVADTANVIQVIRTRLEEAIGDPENVTGDLFIAAANGMGQASVGAIIEKASERLRASSHLANSLAWYNTSLGSTFLGFVSGLNSELNAISVALGTGSVPPIDMAFSPQPPPKQEFLHEEDETTFVHAPQIHKVLDEALAAPTIVGSREELVERIRDRIFLSGQTETLDLFDTPREGVDIPMGMTAELTDSGDVSLVLNHGLRFAEDMTTPEGTVMLNGQTLLVADMLDDTYTEEILMSLSEAGDVLLIADEIDDGFRDLLGTYTKGRVVCVQLTPNSETDCNKLQSVLGGEVYECDNFPTNTAKFGGLGKFTRAVITQNTCKILI